MTDHWQTRVDSPLGILQAVSTRGALVALGFAAASGAPDPRMAAWASTPLGDPLGLQRCIERWFDGDVCPLAGLVLQPKGTPFQQRVWQAVAAIPAGQTLSYSGLAQAVGKKKAVRAVGAAVGRNPVALAIPCHRVVGARGQLTGYAWGLARKRRLLELEGALDATEQMQLFRAP